MRDLPGEISPATRDGSQEDEEGYIANLISEGIGTYVDVGACHPIECSNTWRLYQQGWSGLLIEPNPMYWYGLLTIRPRDRLFPVAIADFRGTDELRCYHSVSSLREDWPIKETERIRVDVWPLRDVLEMFPEIRDACKVCSIDVEGCEGHVLRSIDWETFRPEVFVVEYRWYDPLSYGHDMSSDWSDVLIRNGYMKWHQTGINQIWLRDSLHETA